MRQTHTHTDTYTHIHSETHAHTDTHIHVRTCARRHAHIQVRVHKHTIYAHIHVSTYIQTCTHRDTHTHLCVCTHRDINTQAAPALPTSRCAGGLTPPHCAPRLGGVRVAGRGRVWMPSLHTAQGWGQSIPRATPLARATFLLALSSQLPLPISHCLLCLPQQPGWAGLV